MDPQERIHELEAENARLLKELEKYSAERKAIQKRNYNRLSKLWDLYVDPDDVQNRLELEQDEKRKQDLNDLLETWNMFLDETIRSKITNTGKYNQRLKTLMTNKNNEEEVLQGLNNSYLRERNATRKDELKESVEKQKADLRVLEVKIARLQRYGKPTPEPEPQEELALPPVVFEDLVKIMDYDGDDDFLTEEQYQSGRDRLERFIAGVRGLGLNFVEEFAKVMGNEYSKDAVENVLSEFILAFISTAGKDENVKEEIGRGETKEIQGIYSKFLAKFEAPLRAVFPSMDEKPRKESKEMDSQLIIGLARPPQYGVSRATMGVKRWDTTQPICFMTDQPKELVSVLSGVEGPVLQTLGINPSNLRVETPVQLSRKFLQGSTSSNPVPGGKQKTQDLPTPPENADDYGSSEADNPIMRSRGLKYRMRHYDPKSTSRKMSSATSWVVSGGVFRGGGLLSPIERIELAGRSLMPLIRPNGDTFSHQSDLEELQDEALEHVIVNKKEKQLGTLRLSVLHSQVAGFRVAIALFQDDLVAIYVYSTGGSDNAPVLIPHQRAISPPRVLLDDDDDDDKMMVISPRRNQEVPKEKEEIDEEAKKRERRNELRRKKYAEKKAGQAQSRTKQSRQEGSALDRQVEDFIQQVFSGPEMLKKWLTDYPIDPEDEPPTLEKQIEIIRRWLTFEWFPRNDRWPTAEEMVEGMAQEQLFSFNPRAFSTPLKEAFGKKQRINSLVGCQACGSPDPRSQCSACGKAKYCGQRCADAHWEEHNCRK